MENMRYYSQGKRKLPTARTSILDHPTVQAWFIVASSLLAGLVLAIVWNFEIADRTLGATIASTTLGTDAREVPLERVTPLFGIAFALAAGLAATFTACNFVVFSCIAPLAAEKAAHQRSTWRVVGWMLLGVIVVTSAYGIAGALLGRSIPILSTATLPIGNGDGVPVRLLQSSVVYTTLGACFVVWGLSTLGLIGNPLRKVFEARPWLRPLLVGLMIGSFTVGRPFPLFRKAFEYAADTGNPLLSAGAMAIQGIGNVLLMVLVLLLLLNGTGGRFERWLRGSTRRVTLVTAISLLVGGVFFLAYWGLRVPSRYGIGWFPQLY